MDSEKSGLPLVSLYFSLVKTLFAVFITGITITGIMAGNIAPELPQYSSLFGTDGEGIPYLAILQIGALSMVIGAFYVLLLSDRFIRNMPRGWRIVLLHIVNIVAIAVFWLIFKWGPWIKTLFGLLVFYACCVLAGSVMIIKIRLDDRKYNRLLSHYKKRHKREQ
ncbi:MAG: hypothetical protein LBD48_12670 [Treponema sp.]|jgi:peptidoglycan biosynthesis protein MviN/MurJ (putative lipid II flippase)|nr:hypothetical protein [Treponema sp.]